MQRLEAMLHRSCPLGLQSDASDQHVRFTQRSPGNVSRVRFRTKFSNSTCRFCFHPNTLSVALVF